MPAITERVDLNGFSQSGAVENSNPIDQPSNAVLQIVIDGSGLSASITPEADGVVLQGDMSAVAGLSIINFPDAGISIESDFNFIRGNHLGVDASGMSAAGNQFGVLVNGSHNFIADRNVISGNLDSGINVDAPIDALTSNSIRGNYIGLTAEGTSAIRNERSGIVVANANQTTIGGFVEDARNVISGHDGSVGFSGTGISIGEGGKFNSIAASNDNVIRGNYIGTDRTGTVSVGNRIGVSLFAGSDNNLVGGTDSGAPNVISGNTINGIGIGGTPFDDAENNVVHGNLIGTDASGANPLGNQRDGIVLSNHAINTMVGGILPNEANTIAFNGINGVNVILMAMNNSIRGNNIRSNGNLGIEVSSIGFPSDGVTANDPDDIDSGPNGFQNYPENLVVGFGPSTQVTGNLDSSPNSTFIVDFYFNTQLNASGRGEGELYLGSTTVTTDANGDATFSAANLPPVSAGGFLTATATDEMGNTSEFSDTAVTQATGSISGVKFEDLNGNGSRAIGIQGDNPHVVFVVDVSGSSRGPFQGTPVGNQNPDIDDISDSILDAEIRAFEVLNERLESVLALSLIHI